MPAPRGGRKPPGTNRASGPRRSAPPAHRPEYGAAEGAWRADDGGPRFIPDYRLEPPAGLRAEIADLRAEVKRLAAEIDKLWARERGRSQAGGAGRTARSIAGKPARTGTRASGTRSDSARPAPGGPRAGASGPGRPRPASGSSGTVGRSGPKRAGSSPRSPSGTLGRPAASRGGAKRTGWAKAAPRKAKGAGTRRRGQ